MLDKLLQFLNLSEEQMKKFNELKASFEKQDQEVEKQMKDLVKQQTESWGAKKEAFEGILTDEQKDRMKSLFQLFSPFGNSAKTSCGCN